MKSACVSPDAERILSAGGDPAACRIICAAVRIGLFEACRGRALTCRTLSRRTGCSPSALDRFLQALCSLGYIKEENGRFRCSKAAQDCLCRSGRSYLGSFLLHQESLLEQWSGIASSLKSNTMAGLSRKRLQSYPHQLRLFLEAMDNAGTVKARHMETLLPLRRCRSMLDVGGGMGTYAVRFAQVNQKLRAVVCDLEDVIGHARKNIRASGLQDRIAVQKAQCLSEPLPPGRFDLVFISNLLHIYDRRQARSVLKKAARRLSSGGVLAVHDYIIGCGDQKSVRLFDMTMLTGTPGGRCHTLEDIEHWMHAAGIAAVRHAPVAGGTALVWGVQQQG